MGFGYLRYLFEGFQFCDFACVLGLLLGLFTWVLWNDFGFGFVGVACCFWLWIVYVV